MYKQSLAAAFALAFVLTPAVRADEAQIRKAIEDYVAAFNKKDLPAVTAAWSEKAVCTDRDSGEIMEGRAAIVADIEKGFKERPSAKLTGKLEKVRMVRPDVASVAGSTTVVTPGVDPEVSKFSAVMVKENGRWLIDTVTEGAASAPESAKEALKDLGWLIGTWKEEDSEGEGVETTFKWSATETFLLRTFRKYGKDGDEEHGTQVIAWDARAKQIRSWTFNDDGSFGESTWIKTGDEWIARSSQTLADGSEATGTYVMKRVGRDAIEVKLVGHELDGDPQPSGPAVKLIRVKEPAAGTEVGASDPVAAPVKNEVTPAGAPAHEPAAEPAVVPAARKTILPFKPRRVK
ncbi:MAG TPA: nuclear transport factor 2 family protein [Planctomycetia bacterium]|nr:nuclear transport factor 2 family protein [Planctomycetia bacterium]